ncbi:MAG: conjugal transfer protein TraF, partial [Desulfuromonadales bacterium]|nr:conjugal transfer protein TraF [Desulfuromonadales bacterium]
VRNDINTVPVDGFSGGASYQFQVFTDETQQNSLIAALGGGDEALLALQKLDFIAAQEGIDPETIPGAVDLLETALLNSNGGSPGFDDNTTTVLLQGFGVVEIPLSYGYAINDHLAIGANLKVMKGRVYGNRVVVFDDGADEILKETDEKYKETTNVGLDLGIMARFPYLHLGVIGRNLNSPKFDGFTDVIILTNGQPVDLSVDEVELKPQVTAGVALIPFETLTLEVDYDLTRNETSFPGYDTRNLRFGLEWDALRFLALRAGAYRNMAEDDIDWVYTAGLGLNLWAVRFDIAGAFAGEKEEFDDDEIPKETRIAAQLSVDF